MRTLVSRCVVALCAVTSTFVSAQETCKPAEGTKLPALSAVLDSATLVKNLPAPDAAAAKEVFVSVTTGPVPKAVVMDTTVAKSDAGKLLVQKVITSLRPNAKSIAPTFRLRVLLGEAPALAVVPQLVCPSKER
jgi:hypothetical protein